MKNTYPNTYDYIFNLAIMGKNENNIDDCQKRLIVQEFLKEIPHDEAGDSLVVSKYFLNKISNGLYKFQYSDVIDFHQIIIDEFWNQNKTIISNIFEAVEDERSGNDGLTDVEDWTLQDNSQRQQDFKAEFDTHFYK